MTAARRGCWTVLAALAGGIVAGCAWSEQDLAGAIRAFHAESPAELRALDRQLVEVVCGAPGSSHEIVVRDLRHRGGRARGTGTATLVVTAVNVAGAPSPFVRCTAAVRFDYRESTAEYEDVPVVRNYRRVGALRPMEPLALPGFDPAALRRLRGATAR